MDRLEYFKHLAYLGRNLPIGDNMAKKKAVAVDGASDDNQSSASQKKWMKILSTEWMATAETYSTDEIKKKIVQWEQAISQFEKDMDNDSALNGLKEKMADLKEELKEKSEVYTKSSAETQAQIKFVVHLLDSRGVSA